MPPRYLKRSSPTRLKPCQERTFETCNTIATDGCCGAVNCKLCLVWAGYLGTDYGSADFATSSWTGTVGGISFVSYWERNESGECEYVVIFGGYEVYRATCYEGASCRNPAGEVETTVGTETGTLSWSVYEPRELELIDDPETGCRDFLCDSCRCSCDCLCVVITEYGGDVIRGEICDIAYSCDPPTWAGAVGYYELSLTLGRDQYGNCIITPTVDGVEMDAVAAPGCGSMAATITTPGGDTIAVSCKRCSCDEAEEYGPCSPCPEGTLYPCLVDISFPGLGVTVPSLNTEDTDCDGETFYEYPVEGEFGGYNFQCVFRLCGAAVVIFQDGLLICSTTISGSSANSHVVEYVSCEDPITIIYRVPCEDGEIEVVISG